MFPPFNLERLKEERAKTLQQIEDLTSGKCRIGQGSGGRQIDTTAKWIEHFQNGLAELDRFIARIEQEVSE